MAGGNYFNVKVQNIIKHVELPDSNSLITFTIKKFRTFIESKPIIKKMYQARLG